MLDTDSFDFTLPFSGARVRTDKRGEYLTVYLPHERIGMDDDTSYIISIDNWEADMIIKFLHKLIDMTAMQIEAAFVYDDVAEAGIFDSLILARTWQIGWVQRGRNENYTYIRNSAELAAFLIEKDAFKDIPSMFLDCIDNEELGNKLMDGYELYLLEKDTASFPECIHKYDGCYYACGSRILYKIDK